MQNFGITRQVLLPEALFASETTSLEARSKIDEIGKQERQILREIYGATDKEELKTCTHRQIRLLVPRRLNYMVTSAEWTNVDLLKIDSI